MTQKKGIFKIKPVYKAKRGSMDALSTWDTMMTHYNSVLEQYNADSREDQEAAISHLNQIQDEFGDLFYTSKAEAQMVWTECEDEKTKDQLANFFKEFMIEDEQEQK